MNYQSFHGSIYQFFSAVLSDGLSFALDALLGFWRRRLDTICMALEALSLSGELLAQLFIIFVVSVIYCFAAAPSGSMSKIFIQKAIRSYASWIFLSTLRRFRSAHLMFLRISIMFWGCCDYVVPWRWFFDLNLTAN